MFYGKYIFSVLAGKQVLGFWQKNTNCGLVEKHIFLVLTEQRDYSVLVGKHNISDWGKKKCDFGFGGKTWFYDFAEKTDFSL